MDIGHRLIDEWHNLSDTPSPTISPHLYTCGIANPHHNRYSNILPLDKSIVRLSQSVNREWNPYINANNVDVGKRSFIATQAPMLSSIELFWYMVYTHNVDVIFMLTSLVEHNTVKAFKYWPTTPGTVFRFEKVAISVHPISHFAISKKITETVLVLKRGDVHRKIRHYHYTGWPDFGVPSAYPDFKKLLLIAHASTKGVIVHCSAGCGRAGVFCATYRALTTGEPLSLAVERIRRYRQGMVQTLAQYRYAYMFLQYAIDTKTFN